MKITSLDLAVAAALAQLNTEQLPAGLILAGGAICFSPRPVCGVGHVDYVFISDGGRAMVAITDERGTKSWPLGNVSTTTKTNVLTLLGTTEPTTSPEYEAYRAGRAEMRFSALSFFNWEMTDGSPHHPYSL